MLFPFLVLALLWCLIVNWYPQYKLTLAFSIKLGHMAFSLKVVPPGYALFPSILFHHPFLLEWHEIMQTLLIG
jgi:uncharacterized RDD family membrane protein YckC